MPPLTPTKPEQDRCACILPPRGGLREATNEEASKEEKEENRGGGGSIKDSTLRYNKVHPWKPSAHPALPTIPRFSLGSTSITPFNLLCSSTLLIFPSVLGDRASPSPNPRSNVCWLYRELSRWCWEPKEEEEKETRLGEKEGSRKGERRVGAQPGFLVTGNLKICLRVVEPPEETLLLAATLPTPRYLFLHDPHPDAGSKGGNDEAGAVRRTTPRTKILPL